MIHSLVISTVLLAAEPTSEQADVLKVFRQEFIEITPGTGPFPAQFRMGSDGGPLFERPIHEVKLGHSFWIAKYEVPQNLWQMVMGSNPSKWKGKRNSVEMLTFQEAKEFCTKATKLMRELKLIQADQEIRLPTEAEWEYVARAGTSTKYSFGDDIRQLTDYAWYTRNAAGNDPPVGAKKPNPWGLYDIHGYLWEWCLDGKHDNYEGAPQDGAFWEGTDTKMGVVRGGSWKDDVEKLTSSFRNFVSRDLKDDAVGLRCVLAKVK